MVDRAELFEDGKAEKNVAFQFNPETINFSKVANWNKTPSQSAETTPKKQYRGAGEVKLSLKLLLDDTLRGGQSVSDRVDRLISWTNPDKEAPSPPIIVFSWGRFRLGTSGQFKCHLVKVAVAYTLFASDGRPIRAMCTVELESAELITWGQNPTSGAREPAKAATVMGDELLPELTFRHLGRLGNWREVAEFNKIDNPFKLCSGTMIVLPESTPRSRRG